MSAMTDDDVRDMGAQALLAHPRSDLVTAFVAGFRAVIEHERIKGLVAAGDCSGCRFWNRNGDPWEEDGEEENDYIPVPTKKRKCLYVLHANRLSVDTTGKLAIVTDGSGYSATFWTEPTFSCSCFEPLPSQQPAHERDDSGDGNA